MATALPPQQPSQHADAPIVPVTGNGRDTGHLKQVPPTKLLREQIRTRAFELAAALEKSRPLARHEMETHTRRLLGDLGQPEAYLGWAMVVLASAFWEDQVAAVPHQRRLLLLPRCLRCENLCPAECDEAGLRCQDCGECSLTGLRAEAQRKGYHVMIAEGSPAVMKIILGGHVDAVLGVACLDALEKTLDKILLAGIPAMAVPLLNCGCSATMADDDWVRRMIETPHRSAAVRTRTYLHLMRCAAQMFEPAQLARLAPRLRGGPELAQSNGQGIDALEPIACTEAIAHDFLGTGGKHSRPFITLAVYDALRGGSGTLPQGAQRVAQVPDAVKCIALAIEVFHKASLVHDDIEDNDALRYGRPTLQRQYGSAMAINVGDYLIGLGYRLVAEQHGVLPADMVADIVAQFAHAHTRLCEGQGAELAWRNARDKRIQPLDALKIYALKTAPAFEAALLAGIRLAGPAEPYHEAAARFARHLGVAYQILNDLDDWQGAQPNGRPGGGDILCSRPTILWALALQRLSQQQRSELESLVGGRLSDQTRLSRVGQLYARANVYHQASALIAKHHQRAREAAAALSCEPLRHLLWFLADAILDRRPLAISEE